MKKEKKNRDLATCQTPHIQNGKISAEGLCLYIYIYKKEKNRKSRHTTHSKW
jgi:hypothetical protein